MLKITLTLILTVFVTLSSLAQRNVDPDSNDKSLSNALKEKFPDDDVAISSSKDYITFTVDRKNKKVIVNQKTTEALINLESRSDIQRYYFYDKESRIIDFTVFNKNKRKTGKRINDEAYKSDDLFHVDSRVKYVNLDFPLNGYRYSTSMNKKYNDIKYFTNMYFNDELPIAKKEIVIEVPKWLDLELKEFNFEGFSIKKEESVNPKKNSVIFKYSIENISGYYDENKAPGPSYIYPHILFLAKSFSIDNKKKTLFSSTQDLYNWYKSLIDRLKNEEKPYKEKVVELIENAKSDDEKIKNIYYWVQDNIRYIAFEDGIAGFVPDEAANVFTKKYGDCKGMANLTKQMLIEAGFDARLTWVGTKRIAYDYSTPNLSVDNHMICTLIKNEQFQFLDATEKFNSFGEYAERIQGKEVLIENGDSYILEKVPTSNIDFNKETINYNFVLNGEIIEGSATENYLGESRASLLYFFNEIESNKKEEFLETYINKRNSNLEITNVKTSDLLDRDIPMDISYDISVKNAVSSFDEEVYIDIDFSKQLSNFSLKERKTDYVFDFKKNLEYVTTLEIPATYSINKLPDNISISNDNYELDVKFSKINNTIIYRKKFVFKTAKISSKDFEDWNNFISKLNDTYNEQIIITKK